MLGPARAPVTLVEYGDFECSHCKRAAPVVKLLLRQYPRGLRAVFRHFPLEEVHPHALSAALAAETAGAQGRFWAMHDLIFETQAHLSLPQLRRRAEALALDMVRYDVEMHDAVYLQRVREDIEGAKRSGVRATPTFFANGRLIDVSYGFEALHRTIGQEVAACLPAAGT